MGRGEQLELLPMPTAVPPGRRALCLGIRCRKPSAVPPLLTGPGSPKKDGVPAWGCQSRPVLLVNRKTPAHPAAVRGATTRVDGYLKSRSKLLPACRDGRAGSAGHTQTRAEGGQAPAGRSRAAGEGLPCSLNGVCWVLKHPWEGSKGKLGCLHLLQCTTPTVPQ